MGTQEKARTKEMEIKRIEKEILNFLSRAIREVLVQSNMGELNNIEEIRLRASRPIIVRDKAGEWFVGNKGKLSSNNEDCYLVTPDELVKTLELMSENSIYAYQDEIKNGYLTLRGGHRIGIAGKAVVERDQIKNIKDISSLNVRISREVPNCSVKLFRYLFSDTNAILNTLIISPPQCGKTTILRDIARILGDGSEKMNFSGLKVGIVDERSEIAACYKGVQQNNVGLRTDVLDACPKALGMPMILRSMSPQVIITDEIGNQGDKEAVMKVVNAGVKIITSAHGYNISELKTRREVLSLMEEKVFDRYMVLSSRKGPGTLEEVIDGSSMEVIHRGDIP